MAKAKRIPQPTSRNQQFLNLLKMTPGASWLATVLRPEHRFHKTRKWRFDFAHVGAKVAIEIEGVCWYGRRTSRHQTASGITRDCEKYNAAVEEGWAVLRYTQQDLDKRPAAVIDQVRRVILSRSIAPRGFKW